PTDDFTPAPVLVTFKRVQYNAGDADHDNVLDPGETWQYTSAAAVSRQVHAGPFVNYATVTGTSPAGPACAPDPAYPVGTPQEVIPKKAGNAANPLQPTKVEDADDILHPRPLPVGTPVVWTYLVTNPGSSPLTNVVIVDDNGTATTA